MQTKAFVFVAAGIILLVGLGGLSAQYDATVDDAGNETTVTNETWTPNAGSVTTLTNSNEPGWVYHDDPTVYDENDTKLDAEGNWTWYTENGTIEAQTGGDLDGDANASITYVFDRPTNGQATVRDVSRTPFDLGGSIMVVLGGGLVLAALAFLRGQA